LNGDGQSSPSGRNAEGGRGRQRRLSASLALIAAALAVALAFRPWAVLRDPALRNAWVAALVLLSCLWAAQALLPQALPAQFSGACLLVLMFGWPLAVPTLLLVAAAGAALGGGTWAQAQEAAAWVGVLPATLALALGLATRRWLPKHLFVYILARGFLVTALAMSLAGALRLHWTPQAPGADLTGLLMANWLIGWGEAFMTGALTAIFVAFRPDWLLTYSDRRYLPPPLR
jgi:uncharacterized membrane protein